VDALDEYVAGLEPESLAVLAGDVQAELAHVFPSLILDDSHWADSASVELLGALVRRPPAAAVLIALAARPRQMPERLAAAFEASAARG
jgi:hypothetical protein